MTIQKLLLFSFLQWLLFTALKVWVFKFGLFASPGMETLAYCLLVAVIAAALVRRMGVINYLEAFFLIGLWVLGDMLGDLLITGMFTGLGIFATGKFWYGQLALALSIFLFHKKRHIHVRKELHAHHHH